MSHSCPCTFGLNPLLAAGLGPAEHETPFPRNERTGGAETVGRPTRFRSHPVAASSESCHETRTSFPRLAPRPRVGARPPVCPVTGCARSPGRAVSKRGRGRHCPAPQGATRHAARRLVPGGERERGRRITRRQAGGHDRDARGRGRKPPAQRSVGGEHGRRRTAAVDVAQHRKQQSPLEPRRQVSILLVVARRWHRECLGHSTR